MIAKDIRAMNDLATKLRDRRVDRGSLFFDIPRKVFKLNENQ